MHSITSLTVPRRAFESLRILSRLGAGQATELIRTLSSAPNASSPRTLAAAIETVGDPFTPTLASETVSSLFNLLSLHYTHDWPLVDVVKSVESYSALELSPEEQAVLGSRLSELLNLGPLMNAAKAASIAHEDNNTFHTARIVTDLRPVFADDPAEGARGALIIHSLNLDFYNAKGRDTFQVALDADDLDLLIVAAQRAKQKHQALQNLIHSAGLEDFSATLD